MRRSHSMKIQSIQKEQVQLVQIEKTLKTLLDDIKDSINILKVEELQLKSSLVEHFTNAQGRDEKPMTSAQAAVNTSCTSWLATEIGASQNEDAAAGTIDDGINKQLLDLESLLVPMKKNSFSDVEEEDNDTDEDNIGETETEEDEEFLPE